MAPRSLLQPSAAQLLRNLHRAPPGACLERLELEARRVAQGLPVAALQLEARPGLTRTGEARSGEGGGLLLWPQEVIAQIDQVNSAVDVLWNEIENAGALPGASGALLELRAAFGQWRDQWQAWRRKNSDYWQIFWGPSGVQDALLTWSRTLDAWREKFRALGGAPIAPKPPPPPAPSPVLQTVDNLSYAAIAVAAAAGLFIIVRTVKGGI